MSMAYRPDSPDLNELRFMTAAKGTLAHAGISHDDLSFEKLQALLSSVPVAELTRVLAVCFARVQ
jgi:hypothetical protein